MTTKQAIEYGKDLLRLMLKSEETEFIEMAIDALELQIAKKPIEKVHVDRCGHDVYEYYCPNCEELAEPVCNYCDTCGQCIDWSDWK